MNDQIKSVDQYWKKNIQIVSILLTIWFFASFGFGIIFANRLDEINFFGFNLGFWFAQQGSIFIFVIIIFIYIRLMKNLDQQYKDNTNNKKQT